MRATSDDPTKEEEGSSKMRIIHTVERDGGNKESFNELGRVIKWLRGKKKKAKMLEIEVEETVEVEETKEKRV